MGLHLSAMIKPCLYFTFCITLSDSQGPLIVPRVRNRLSGCRAFSYHGLLLWYHLFSYIRHPDSIETFKSKLKT